MSDTLLVIGVVTPCAGVWIEMSSEVTIKYVGSMSLPVRECGLKSFWLRSQSCICMVTPCAGVWIEILDITCQFLGNESLPVRECGLKW